MPLNHVSAKDAARAQSSRQVGFEDGIPLGLGKIERGHFLGAAGTIHEDLDAAEFGADGLQQFFDAGVVGDVAGLIKRTAAKRSDLPGGAAHQFGAAACGDDVGAGLSKTSSKGEANPASSANYDGSLVRQFKKWMAHECSRMSSIFLQPVSTNQ